MSWTTTGHPLRQRIAESLFVLLCVSFFSVLAGCSDDDSKAVNAVPVLASVSPVSATAGGPAFTLTATGSSFLVTSAVHWNGTARPTTFVSTSQLQAEIPASDLATAGTAQVTVVTPAPGGGTSSAVTFTIQNPVPIVTSLTPRSVASGSAAFDLTVNGSGFVPGSTVEWRGAVRETTFVNSGALKTAIGSADVASAGIATVRVVNPTPGGGTSNAVTFTITLPPVSTGTAEGLWWGTTPTGRNVLGLVRGNGEYWFIYTVVGNSAVIGGFVQGNGTSQNSRFTSSNGIDFNFESAGNLPATIDATYVTQSSLDGTVKYTGSANVLAFTTQYDLDYGFAAPQLGPWITTTFTGTSYGGLTEYTELTIATSGALTGVSASRCRFSGALTPSTDGHYYEVSVTFEGGACVNGTSTVIGVAYFDFYARELIAVALDSTRTRGFLFFGSGPPY